ncbi:MAG: patatin-like phospholipase family protein [Thermoanaerobaculia bacterium]|nr:patatin-like phospholipase family protein [Thermoanaerobaculia bacterium]
MTNVMDRLGRARRIGFLFSGGASRCVFQVGVVEALFQAGIHPAACLGVSAGSWNAAAVAAGNWRRLRAYWRFFCRMPALDLTNLAREHSPFAWRKLHTRAFRRYVSAEALRAESALPFYAALTRLRDRESVVVDVRTSADPLEVMLASNYLPPFYTHAPVIDGERYGDGAVSNNIPYEALFERGCDAVVLITQKGACEGGLFRNIDDPDHVIPEPYRDDVVVIRPRHPLEVAFAERRWERLAPAADLGAEVAREVLGGREFGEPANCRHPTTPIRYLMRVRALARLLASGRDLRPSCKG